MIEGSDGDEDADMRAVPEDESDEEMGVTQEDVDDEVSTILLAQTGQSSKSYRRDFKKSCTHLVSELPFAAKNHAGGQARALSQPRSWICLGPHDCRPWIRQTVGFHSKG